MSDDPTSAEPTPAQLDAAGQWLARRDRGLTGQEQDDYLQWLRDDPRHGRASAQLERAWHNLDALGEWCPAHATRPNPDLLAPPRSPHWRFFGQMAAAFLLIAGFLVSAVYLGQLRSRPPRSAHGATPSTDGVTGPDAAWVKSGAGATQRNERLTVRLEFTDAPLSDVVAEFNARNRQQLAVADRATGAVRIAGAFRADDVDGFVRFAESTFGLRAERRTDGTVVLRRATAG